MRAFLALATAVRARPVRILDVGGNLAFWLAAEDLIGDLDLVVTIVNVVETEAQDIGRYSLRPGDARDLSQFPDAAFDIVHSNSVIEHVGCWDCMQAFAREARRLAPRHFIQTPNYWFPVEPHFRTPFYHWLPERLRAQLLIGRRLGFRGPAPNLAAAIRLVKSVRLLDGKRFGALFPGSQIRKERWLGLTKSLVAVQA